MNNLNYLLKEIDERIRLAQSVGEVDRLKDLAAIIQKMTLEEISPSEAAKRRVEDYHGPRKLIEVNTDDGRRKVGKLSHKEAEIDRGVPSWVVKMIRFLVFIPLAFVAWVILIGWLAGDGGTSVTGRIVAASAGLIFLLIITAYIHEFNQRHP